MPKIPPTTLEKLRAAKEEFLETYELGKPIFGVGMGQGCIVVYVAKGYKGDLPEKIGEVTVRKMEIEEPAAL